jgi:hypothetical protein
MFVLHLAIPLSQILVGRRLFDYHDHLPTPNGVTAPNPVTTTLRISFCVSTASHQRKDSTEIIPKTAGNTDVMTAGLKVDGVRFLEFPLLAEMEKTARRHRRHALCSDAHLRLVSIEIACRLSFSRCFFFNDLGKVHLVSI